MNTGEKKFVPVMITPFNHKVNVDLDNLSRLIDFYLASGVKGLFANCLSSEMFSISEDEMLELAKHIVDYVNGAVPVVATGSFGLTIEDKAEFSRKIYDTGINAVIMITGHFANVEDNDEVLLRNFEKCSGLQAIFHWDYMSARLLIKESSPLMYLKLFY